MDDKRLTDGGDRLVLLDAAKAKRKLPRRGRQLPVLLIFAVIAAISAAWALIQGL